MILSSGKVDIHARYVKKHGAWDAHSIEYAPGKFTFGNASSAAWMKSRGEVYVDLIEMNLKKPLSELRVLDIGCFEGGLSFHLAKAGCSVVGLEIRDEHLGKCGLIKECFPDLKIDFIKGNMLELEKAGLGSFDAILMAGTLYHIDAPDIIPTLKTLRGMLSGVLIVDTHIAQKTVETYYDAETDTKLYGRSIIEHNEGDKAQEREVRLRTSYTNNFSFWPTRVSLTNALVAAGFNWVSEPLAPKIDWPMQDRVVVVGGATPLSSGARVKKQQEPDPRPTDHSMLHNRTHFTRPNPSTKRL